MGAHALDVTPWTSRLGRHTLDLGAIAVTAIQIDAVSIAESAAGELGGTIARNWETTGPFSLMCAYGRTPSHPNPAVLLYPGKTML